MNVPASLTDQLPIAVFLVGCIAVLLKIIQGLYITQITDLKADRDAWREIAMRGTQLAKHSTDLAEDTASRPRGTRANKIAGPLP